MDIKDVACANCAYLLPIKDYKGDRYCWMSVCTVMANNDDCPGYCQAILQPQSDRCELFQAKAEGQIESAGKWIIREQISEYRTAHESPIYRIECSKCHGVTTDGIKYLPPVCPHCNSAMRGRYERRKQ